MDSKTWVFSHISGIKEFYEALDRREMEGGTPVQDADKIRYEYGKILAVRMREKYNVPRETVASLFSVSENTITNWVNAWKSSHPSV